MIVFDIKGSAATIMKGTKVLTLGAKGIYACDTCVCMHGTVIGGLVHKFLYNSWSLAILLRVSLWLATLLDSTRESTLVLHCNAAFLQKPLF